jgi:hypothetical protein
VVLETVEDTHGTAKNKVVRVKPPRKGKTVDIDSVGDSEATEKGFKSLLS